MKAYVIEPFGDVIEADLNLGTWGQLREIIGSQTLELVSVLYNGKPATMFVNENGIAEGDVPNVRATAIYWTATIRNVTGMKFEPLSMSMIYGVAILFEIAKNDIP